MLSKLWQNAVMTSAVECYCLPCESHLRSSSDAELHVAKPVHVKALGAAPYADGYGEDRIRKVPNGFYCEFCNLLFTTSSKVTLHVSDPSHLFTKGTQLLKRNGSSIIAFSNVSLSEKAWNGFQGKTCVVCSKDFVFETIHKSEKEHIIKLIQSKVEFGEGNSIYRKTDDGYQCLTCNEEFLLAKYDAHFSSTEHKNKYDECKISVTQNHVDENHNVNGDQENVKKDSVKPKEVKKTVTPKQEVKKEAVKQEGKKSVNENNKPVNNTKNDSEDKMESQDPYEVDKKFREVLDADEYVCNMDNQFCILCEIDVTEPKKVHIASSHHQKLLKLHKDRLAKRKASNASVNESNNATAVVNESNKKETVEQKSPSSEPKDEQSSKKENKVDDNNKDKILDSISELTKDGINVNFETSVASCKSCKKVIEFDYDVIKNHIAEHKIKKEPTDKFDWAELKEEPKNTTLFSQPVTLNKGETSKKEEEKEDNKEMIEFAKKNGLEVQDNYYKCNVCAVHLTQSQVKGHVHGKAHKNRAQRQKNKAPERALVVFTQKVPMSEFIKDLTRVENLAFTDFVINFKYCVNVLSFFMYTKHGSRLRCQACRVNLTRHDVDIHKMEHEHQEKMEKTMVVTSIPDEFIREVQPQVLHCGYCNLAVDERDMTNHLACTQHRDIKRAMMARLHNYLPGIRERQRERAGIEAVFLHMIARAAMMHHFFGNDDDDY